MLKQKSAQESFYGNYLYDKIVPSDHLLRKINRVVDFSFVNDLVKDRYTLDFGRPAEDPEFMLRLCLLQYLYGDSDRQVIENARINLAYKYFLGLAVDEDVPDDTTISFFRAQRLGEEKFRQVFEQIVRQCIDKGLVKGKRQIIDSTHIIADIAINSLTGLIKLCRQNVLSTIEKQNAQTANKLGLEDLQFTQQDKYTRKEDNLEEEIEQAKALLDGVNEELKQGKLKVTERLRDNINLLEKVVADREDGAADRLVSPVDKDARAGKKNSKHWSGYKGHVVMEEDSEIITAVETTSANKPDGNQLPVLLQQQEESVSLVPQELSADKAYGIGANLEILDSKNITGNISLIGRFNRLGAGLFTQDDFKYDKSNDTLTCPAGCIAPHRKIEVVYTESQRRKGIIFQFSHRQCSNCELKASCFPVDSKTHGRGVNISVYEPLFKDMRERMQSEDGQEAYRNRYRIEHKVADLARWCGMRRCRYRGLARAKIHTLLSAITSNIKRMVRLLCRPPLEAASAC
jgi:transposase